MNPIDTLRTWANLGRAIREARPARVVDWSPVARLIQFAKPVLEAERKRFIELLKQSRERLTPFGDPLDTDMGLHRWLASDREESYSDWLEWIVEHLSDSSLIFDLFRLPKPLMALRKPEVRREVTVDSGHDGQSGRLDLVIRFPGHALIVVEVKLGDADYADTDKHAGYATWARQQPEKELHMILLATQAEESEYHGFEFVSWRHVCIFLRRLAARNDAGLNHMQRALMLAFVGAVEQNLLGFHASLVDSTFCAEAIPFDLGIVDYLESSLQNGKV